LSVKLSELTEYLDEYLRIREVGDDSRALNGLQVDGPETVFRIVVAVDACQASIDASARLGAQLLLVHHGLFWSGPERISGRHGRRVRALIQNDIGLYAAHIPLDVHPEVGNNAVLAKALGLSKTEWFGDYAGQPLGVAGALSVSRDEVVSRVRKHLGVDPHVIACGPDPTSRVGIITGGGGSMIAMARDAGVDTYITGEGAHHTHFDAEEYVLNVIYAGHYATETVGVKALAEHLAIKFAIEWEFVDHPTGL